MYLKRLEIQGFKSFAKKTIMEFETGITAIVGPNGSGKSNSADCLRWVLGEQSAKMMRGKKSEDVIFAGSDKRSRAGFAEVIATFDNADRKIPIDSAEVSIGRRVSRSGESEYLINGNRARLLDIIDLVLKSNIGTSRYTVIGQGTIDQMILAGPSEIKNLIDEASGVKVYYMKRDRSMRRLEQTAQNLMRAEDLMRELEPRVKSLRRQAKRMEARAELENELQGYLHKHLGYLWWQHQSSLQNINSKISALQAERNSLEEKISAHLQAVESYEAATSDSLLSVRRDQEDLQSIVKEKNALLEQVSLIQGKLDNLKTTSGDQGSLEINQHQITQDLQITVQELSGLSEKLQTLESAQAKFAQTISDLNNQIDLLYQSSNSSSGHDGNNLEWQEVQGKVEHFGRSLSEFESFLEEAEDILTIKHQAGSLVKSWRALEVVLGKPNETAQNLQQLKASLKELGDQKDQLLSEQNRVSSEISKIRAEQQFLTNKHQTLQKDLLQVELELKRIATGASDEFVSDALQAKQKLQSQIEDKLKIQQSLENKINNFYNSEQDIKKQLQEADKEFRLVQSSVSSLRDDQTKLEIEKARIETQNQTLEQEIIGSLSEVGLQKIQEVRIELQEEGLSDKIAKLKHQLEMIGGVDELTIQEYRETEARFTGLESQVLDLKKGIDDLRSVMDELDSNIKEQFNKAFHEVNEKFEQYFKMLFNGGKAHLALVKPNEDKTEAEGVEEESESMDENQKLRPEEKIVAKYENAGLHVAGVDIKATPPGKKLSSIQSLSGGERSLTSIALLCSLLTCFPSPFVVLDEVDAALDEANTIRFGQILGKLSHQTQFITITHNRETMSQARIIYGVTMGDDGASQLLSIKLDEASAYAKAS